MLQLLFVAQVPLAGVVVLTGGFVGAGSPETAAIGEAIALSIAIAILVPTLHRYGGMAASIVSIVAYTVSLTFLLTQVGRKFESAPYRYIVPFKEDVLSLLREGTRYTRRALSLGRSL
jgi:hypothetical protein